MAQMAPSSLYTNSSIWNSTVWHISAISGPAIGGSMTLLVVVAVAKKAPLLRRLNLRALK